MYGALLATTFYADLRLAELGNQPDFTGESDYVFVNPAGQHP